MGVEEPAPVKMTSLEFLERLAGDFGREAARQHSRTAFLRDPEKYRRMGLNEFLEKDVQCREEIVLPAMGRDELLGNASRHDVSVRIDRLNKDPGILVILASGTRTGIASFKQRLEEIHSRLPSEMEVSGTVRMLDVPPSMQEAVIGRNGVNIYRIQRRFGVVIRALDRPDGARLLVVSGAGEKVQNACSSILDTMYGDITE